MRVPVVADDAPFGAGPYSPAILDGDFLYLSGIGALHPEAHEILGHTIEVQTRDNFRNIEAILRAGGASLDDVIKIDAYLQDPHAYEAYNRLIPSISNHRIRCG